MKDKENITELNTPTTKSPKTKRKWLRRLLISLGVLLLVLILAISAVIIWLGPIAEYVVERYDKELVGRRLQMDNLRIKVFKGEMSVDSLRLYEANDSTTFISLNRFETMLEPREIFRNHIDIRRIALTEPSVNIAQRGSSFNFDDMLQFIDSTYLATEEQPQTESEPWRISIKDVRLDGGYVSYLDQELDQQWLVSSLMVQSDSILLHNAMTRIDASLEINRQARLAGNVGINLESLDFEFEGSLQKFQLNDIYKYVVPVVNLRELYGTLSTELSLVGNINNVISTEITGNISLDELHLTGPDGGELFAADNLSAEIQRINLDKQHFALESLTSTGYSTQFIMRKNGTTNFDGLFYEEPEVSIETTSQHMGGQIYDQKERVTITTHESVAPFSGMTLKIGHLNLAGGYIYFVDKTMNKEFKYKLHNISIESKNFNIAARNKLTVRATTNNQGSALIRWEGALDDFYNQSILASLSNVAMKDFTPYAEHYTAFPITSGNLTFKSQNIITNGELSGMNRMGTYDFGVGKKDKSLDPEFNLPLRLGVWVLTDKDKHIDVDLPITGHIDSPEFSYRKVIFKAIGNLLLKIVASPFSWMSSDKQETFQHIDFDLLDPTLNSEQYARIDKIAAALKEDSSIKVRLTQSVNYERAQREIADLNLKMAYYNSTQVESDHRLDMLDLMKINDMRLSGKEVVAFADSMLVARGIDPSHLSTHAKAQALYGDMVDKQLTMMFESRAKIIREYVGFQHKELAAESFVIESQTTEQMKSYKGKPRLILTLIIDDEEVNIETNDETESEETTNEENDNEASDNKAPRDALAENKEE